MRISQKKAKSRLESPALYAKVVMAMQSNVLQGEDNPEFRRKTAREWDEVIRAQVEDESPQQVTDKWANIIGLISNVTGDDSHLLQEWISAIEGVVKLPETRAMISLMGRIANTQMDVSICILGLFDDSADGPAGTHDVAVCICWEDSSLRVCPGHVVHCVLSCTGKPSYRLCSLGERPGRHPEVHGE